MEITIVIAVLIVFGLIAYNAIHNMGTWRNRPVQIEIKIPDPGKNVTRYIPPRPRTAYPNPKPIPYSPPKSTKR
ncbi:hypothetical protein FDA94_29060 [Herbidospora galbida]|uniref:Uncharacterized protein n=1 Tax=Herbidospora galbida TaxID=2575442 RepID=A0A4U3MAQ7_9ACTN|nr:hypothetical protein [Herbidospora galbida]TKK84666.1 hypothetical protein FDA94_29060 [Herbidospora galbida]